METQTSRMPYHKYKPVGTVVLPDRRWPDNVIEKAPTWCSVDLRDGNQALVVPMNVEEKLDMFRLLVDMGFKEIEVGFPSASTTEHDFIRMLIDRELIPADVTIQVLTPAREHLIVKTFDAIAGARRAIVHLYNSTSTLQRRVVFGLSRQEIIGLAVQGATWIRREAGRMQETSPDADIRFEYSPESFTATEDDFAVDICEAVLEAWNPTPERKVIVNLPATVEMTTPNVYADRIEWFGQKVTGRDRIILSAHAHNDRGTAVAATELALMAGAERVEGTLFGNGERTGNVDLVSLSMNLFSKGIDPRLDMGDMNRIVGTYERCTRMPVHARHPYAGELVYTAFSGSHQDAIRKGMKAARESGGSVWEVPYLPIDPADVGRSYESVIRINSQSGKGGVAFVMEQEFGFVLPKAMHPEFGAAIQAVSDRTGEEVPPSMIRETFEKEYIQATRPIGLMNCRVTEAPMENAASVSQVDATLDIDGQTTDIGGSGNGPIDAFCNALTSAMGIDFKLVSYHEHSLEAGSDSRAVAYIGVEVGEGRTVFGVGIDTSIDVASFRALLCALNRSKTYAGATAYDGIRQVP